MSKASKRTRPAAAPGEAAGHFERGNRQRAAGRPAAAEASYRRALAIEPAFASAWNNLGALLKDTGRGTEAAEAYRRAIAARPDYALAHNNLGVALLDAGRHEDALAACRNAVAIDPDYPNGHYNLGRALHELGHHDAAADAYRRALALRPDFAEAHNGLADALQAVGLTEAALAHYRAALARHPDNDKTLGNLLFVLNYLADRPPAAMLAEARRYGALVAARATPFRNWRGRPDPDRRLRVGLVSGDLVQHPVGYFLESTLAGLDPGDLELYAYANSGREDALTRRIKPYFAAWRRVDGLDDAGLARRIHADAVDILIDLAGHTARNRLPVFAWRPAPVQASWLGYFATTGVPGIDYFLADARVCPDGEEAHFSETVVRLPDTYYCFTPPAAGPEPGALPAAANGYLTFGSCNRLAKLNDAVLATWARILTALPDARLLLKAAEFADPARADALRARLAGLGVDPARLAFEAGSPRTEYLATYRRIDIALDPFPFPGGATTAEALWMGVPVLGLRGDRFIGRQGETILASVGLTDWLAEDRDDYVARALRFARDADAVARLRAGLRARLLASPLCDAARFAGRLGDALRTLWRHYCGGQAGPAPDRPAARPPGADLTTRPGADLPTRLGAAMAALHAGRPDAAAQRYRAILAERPDQPEALAHLGLALCQCGRLAEALPHLRRAAELDPADARAPLYLGLAQRQMGDLEAAAASYREAAARDPDDALAPSYLGNALLDLGHPEAALASYERALARAPGLFQNQLNRAEALYRLGRLADAADGFRRAIAVDPDAAVAHNNLGNALAALGDAGAAEPAYRRAIALQPGYHEAHNNLGVALHLLDRHGEALACYAEAMRLRPDFAEAVNNHAGTLQDLGRTEAALAGYRAALALAPDNAETHSNLLYAHNYLARATTAEMLAEARRYGALVAARATPFRDWPVCREPDRRLRVGLVSGDLREHPVGYFLETTLAALDPARIELYAYASECREDALSARIKGRFAAWRCLRGRSDAEAAAAIRADAVDILIDLAGHTAHNRLPVFAWRPAPVQATWLGYFASTGVPGIDYLIADPYMVPAGEEAHFSETVVRLPEVYYCYSPPAEALEPGPAPVLAGTGVTFGCFNRLAKMNDAVVALWADLLHAVPDARLVLKAKGLADPDLGAAVLARYAARGIGPERLILEGAAPRRDYLAAYRRIDLALDPFPFPGGTTSADALWMGVPVLTLRGDRFVGHQGETILRNVGLAELIAADPADYLAKAAALATDPAALACLRAGLRARLLASPLCDAARFAGHLEAALRGLWRAWCEGRPDP